jgi:antitoxin PrlF
MGYAVLIVKFTARLTRDGRITIPKHVRDWLRLKAGDKVEFGLAPNRQASIPKEHVSAFTELLGHAGEGLTTDEIMALTRDPIE